MKLDYHIDSPYYGKAPAHWWRAKEGDFYLIDAPGVSLAMSTATHYESEIVAVCRAFHVAKLAADYAKAKAAMDAAATSADMESVRSAYYDAARALCEAVR